MISPSVLQKLSDKFQTTQQNINREYIQHLFLSQFYQQKESQKILFKGGTALRIAFNSPRFSEDLDFSAPIYNTKIIENSIISTLSEIEHLNIKTNIIESKETTGGYFSEIEFSFNDTNIPILLQFSKRKGSDNHETITISNDFIPPYVIFILCREQLFDEKIQALLTRAKPRDFYDIYFLIRSNYITQFQKKMLIQVSQKLKTSTINFDYELKQFLPKSHWSTIKDFQNNLNIELNRFM